MNNHKKTIEMIKEVKNEETLIQLLDDWYRAWNGNGERIKCHAYDDIHGNRKYRIDNLFGENERRYYTFEGFKNALIRFINFYLEGRCAGESQEYYEEESEWIYSIFKNTLEEEFKPTMVETLKTYNVLILIANESVDVYELTAKNILNNLDPNVKNFYTQYNRFTKFTKQGAFNDIISVIKMAAETMEVNLPAVPIDLSNIENSYEAIWNGIYKQIPMKKETVQETFKLAQEFMNNEVARDADDYDRTDIGADNYEILSQFIQDYIHAKL